MHIDTDALLACVRETLALHLEDNAGLAFADVEVLDRSPAGRNAIRVVVDGVAVDLILDAPEV